MCCFCIAFVVLRSLSVLFDFPFPGISHWYFFAVLNNILIFFSKWSLLLQILVWKKQTLTINIIPKNQPYVNYAFLLYQKTYIIMLVFFITTLRPEFSFERIYCIQQRLHSLYLIFLISISWFHLNISINIEATTLSKEEITDNHRSVLSSFGVSIKDDDCDLPILYWTPQVT